MSQPCAGAFDLPTFCLTLLPNSVADLLHLRTVICMAGNHTHVAVGLLVGVGVAAVLHLDPEATALFAMTSGGAALLPDLDDDTSAVTDAAGVVLALPLSIFRRIVIRHRGPTHALPICLALAVVVYWVGHLFGKAHGSIPAYWPIRLLMPVLLALLGTRSALRIGSGEHLRPLLNHRHRFYIEVLAGLCIGYIGYTMGPTAHFALGMALAVGVGAASHALIDVPFESGVPLFWPFVPSLNRHVSFGHHKVGGTLDHFTAFVAVLATFAFVTVGTFHGGPMALRWMHHVRF